MKVDRERKKEKKQRTYIKHKLFITHNRYKEMRGNVNYIKRKLQEFVFDLETKGINQKKHLQEQSNLIENIF